MLIGQIANDTGLSRDTIRYYERRGLLGEITRRDNGYKDYPPDSIARLRFVKRLQRAGFTLRDAGAFLALHADGEATCENVAPIVAHQLADIDARIQALRAMRKEIEATFETCARTPKPAFCKSIHEALKS